MSFFTYIRHCLDKWNVSLWFWCVPLQSIHELLSNGLIWLRSWLGPQGTDIPTTLSSPSLAQCRLGLESSWTISDETKRIPSMHIWPSLIHLRNIGKGTHPCFTLEPPHSLCDHQSISWTDPQTILLAFTLSNMTGESGMVPANDEDTPDESVSFPPVDSRT